jgi:hypothetical protein
MGIPKLTYGFHKRFRELCLPVMALLSELPKATFWGFLKLVMK